jgi:RimJ/RimL family protein N-acetyltransferase
MLKPYTHTDFELLQSWITDGDMLFRFAGTEFSYPIDENQILNYQAKYPERRFYMGHTEEGMPFSFGEIIPQDDGNPRLGRLLIGDPGLRGKGLGVYFVKLLIDECVKLSDPNAVELYVSDSNVPAIQCYKRAGFRLLDLPPFVLVHNNVAHNIVKMRLTIEK